MEEGGGTESIEWFIEDKAYDWPPPPLSPPSVSSPGHTQEDWETETTCSREGGGGGLGEEPNHTTARKPGPL